MTDRVQFTEELAHLDDDILAMGIQVEENLKKALHALNTSDVVLAREVRANDAIVDAFQLQIEDQAAILIATQSPVAHDVRKLVAVFKVVENLERAGDYASHLAKTAIKLSREPPLRQKEHLMKMAGIGVEMVRGAVDAYIRHDVEEARRVAALDDEIDHENKALLNEILVLMKENPALADHATKMIRTSGFLERLGDHMTNICEAVIFMEEGKHIELNE
jgi:phosphate transport system protein